MVSEPEVEGSGVRTLLVRSVGYLSFTDVASDFLQHPHRANGSTIAPKSGQPLRMPPDSGGISLA